MELLSKLGLEGDKIPNPSTEAKEESSSKGSGREPSPVKPVPFLGLLLLLVLFAMAYFVYDNNQKSKINAAYMVGVADLSSLPGHLSSIAGAALKTGDVQAFRMLQESQLRYERTISAMIHGGALDDLNVPASPENVQPLLQALNHSFVRIRPGILEFLSKQAAVTEFSAKAETMTRSNAMIQGLAGRIVDFRLRMSSQEILAIDEIITTARRIERHLLILKTPNGVSEDVFNWLVTDGRSLGVWINSLDKGGNPEIAQKLTDLKNAYTTFQEASEGIRGSVEDIKRANQSFLIIANGVDALLRGADTVARAYRFDSAPFFMKLSGLMAIAILLLIALIRIPIVSVAKHIQESRRQAEISEKERQASVENNKITQAAIMRLMDELGDLADGDLTISATVTEDVTGVIADSINYAVEELRGLVKKINEASSQVTDATRTAQHTSSRLLEAARHQSLIIEETGNSVLAMASSMTTISHEADLSAKVAHSSLAASQKGTHAVNNSIRSMNQIRGQIQETAKRIKRLGESSQEIGEIVELISNITEQTNVLALNSAIQAASAGEAGRGFTVIAEEIQLLAERSAEATKQINALVKTIQTDTQEAILAMEESTQGVVDGAKLSDAAGQALTEIGTVSQQLAELIEKISATTKNQADSAANVAKRMQDILQVTQQATVGTQKTASAIGELNVLATELKGSVAGFKVS